MRPLQSLLSVALIWQRFCVELFFVFHVLISAVCFRELSVYAVDLTSNNDASRHFTAKLVSVLTPTAFFFTFFAARYFAHSLIIGPSVAMDRQSYAAAWVKTLAEEGISSALADLASLSKRITAGLDPSAARQYYSQRNSDAESLHPRGAEAPLTLESQDSRSLRRRVPVSSLRQVLDQAGCLSIFLESKLGALVLGSSPRGVDTDGLPARVRVSVKPRERALQKAIRCYDADPSRIVDCCRASIRFDRVSEVLAFLEAASRDEDLEIVRVKNGYSDTFDSERNGGFRSCPRLGMAFIFYPHIVFVSRCSLWLFLILSAAVA